MNKLILSVTLGAALTGCVTTTYEAAPAQPPRQIEQPVVQTAAVKAPKAGPAAKKNAPKPAAAPAIQGKATEIVKPLRVLVSIDDGNDAEKPSIAKKCLQSNIEGALAKDGFRVVYTKPAEILVYTTISGKKVNARGTRVAWKAEADVEVTRAPEVNVINGQTMSDVVAKKRFDVKSGDARDNDEAQKICADRLGPDASKFAKEAVNKVGGKLKACEITIINAWQPQDAAGYPTLFAQKVAAMPGVYSCKVVATDNAARTMKAEIIYDAASYPDGLVNRLYVTPELNITR